ncbi:MAG TPA: AcvB/VirJ family lysyl-phosphatidylglycerol hydrolase [Longimicrobium sp.]|nr:AcvB/VirJ family lysyl-phosphatidylglycerol hydrolase [Longimicrobium sp.]
MRLGSAPRAGDAMHGGPAPAAPRSRRLRHIAAGAAMVAVLAAAGFRAYRLAYEWGYFTPRASVGSLPLVEVPARKDVDGDLMVVLLSADGGWARLDQELAARLAAAGYPVVGWNSMRYYRTPRTPAVAADDLTAVMRSYQRKWHRPRVLLVGYSFGADVLPIITKLLPDDDRRHLAGVVLLGFWKNAEFQFTPAEWVGRETGVTEYPTLPAARRLTDVPVLCIGGDHDRRSVCSRIGTPNVRVRTIPAGHSLGAHVGEIFKLMIPMIRKVD